jgi:hypothetical protein
MSGIENIGGFSANVPATEKLPTIRTQVTEKIHGKVDEKLKSAGVSEDTREALLADLTQQIEGQMSSGGLPDPKAIRESISVKQFRPNGSRLLTACTAFCIIVGFVQHGVAQDASLTGDWTHSRDAKEQAQRYEAIDRATQGMNGLMRGRARETLRAKTTPLSTIRLTDEGDRVTFSRQNRRVTFTTDGLSTRVNSERGAATVRAQRQNGKLIVKSQAQNGVQTAVYSLSEDGMRLILDTSVSGGKLKEPVRYRTTYHRAESR